MSRIVPFIISLAIGAFLLALALAPMPVESGYPPPTVGTSLP